VPNPAFETVAPPFTTFRFEVALELDEPPPGLTSPVCNAAFSECDGLEMSIEPKTVREGGNNRSQIHLVGPTTYSQLTLKRGMSANLDLWRWFVAAATPGRRSTAQGQVTLWDADGTPRITFALTDCLPVKMRGPSLNASTGLVAIEEMQLVYALMDVRPAGQGGGFGLDVSAGIGAGASVGFGAAASISGSAGLGGQTGSSASASLSASAGFGS
jgi:phage tail-like protein